MDPLDLSVSEKESLRLFVKERRLEDDKAMGRKLLTNEAELEMGTAVTGLQKSREKRSLIGC